MSEETVVRFCAPTLANLKAGCLFSCAYGSRAELVEEVRGLNRRLTRKGLRVVPLRVRGGRALIYVYRPQRLSDDLSCPIARHLLENEGYELTTPDQCLCQLIRRLREAPNFPHEIGLFLGYPPADVKGFIDGCEAKCCGYWKVYGDVPSARRTFARYRRCTDTYLNRLKHGAPLEQLAV